MADSLEGRRIVLTGASRGIGRCAAERFIAGGADVLGIARDAERLARAREELAELGPGSFETLVLDVTAADSAQRLADRVAAKWGAVDTVIHNAAVMLHHDAAIMAEPEGILEQTLDVNVLAPFRATRALVPLLLEGVEPRVVNVGSGAGTHKGLTEPGIASYRLSKWTLHGLTMLQAAELEGQVSVIAFDPDWVKTDLGGPDAPGTPQDAADGLLATLRLPWERTGGFFKDGKSISW
ncbi:MAG: SDR family NAD(P)-dependent oxidoreductase [Myxococcota bacterium]